MRYILIGLLMLPLSGRSFTLPSYTEPPIGVKHPLGIDECGEGP